jgi:hypothetical protein
LPAPWPCTKHSGNDRRPERLKQSHEYGYNIYTIYIEKLIVR